MTKEAILEQVLAINNNGELNGEKYSELVEALKSDIRAENSRHINANTYKLAKAILDNAVRITGGKKNNTRSMMRYSCIKDGVQYVLDSHRIAAFIETLDLPLWDENDGNWYNVERLMNFEYDEELTLPSVADIKIALKQAKVTKSRCVYVFENGLAVNAQYLLDFMQGFGESMQLFMNAQNSLKAPVYITADDGAGILLPVNNKDNLPCGFHTMQY